MRGDARGGVGGELEAGKAKEVVHFGHCGSGVGFCGFQAGASFLLGRIYGGELENSPRAQVSRLLSSKLLVSLGFGAPHRVWIDRQGEILC